MERSSSESSLWRAAILRDLKAQQVAEEEAVLHEFLRDSPPVLSVGTLMRVRARVRVDTPRAADPRIRRRDVRLVDLCPSGERVDRPPPWPVVPRLLDELFVLLNGLVGSGICPLLAGAAVHHGIAAVHPFLNGNGRTARIIGSIIAALGPGTCRVRFSLVFAADPETYYALVGRTLHHPEDFAAWARFLAQGTPTEGARSGTNCGAAGTCGFTFDVARVVERYGDFLREMEAVSRECSEDPHHRD